MGGGRLVASRIVAGLAALFWGWLFFGVQDTLTVFVEGRDFAAHYLMESGWGLLFLLLVAVPAAGLAYKPRSPVLVAEIGAVGLAVIGGALLAGSAVHLLPGAGLLMTAAALGTVAPVDLRARRPQLDRPLGALVAVALLPAAAYAWRMARSTHDVEQTVKLDHYPIQAALGIAVPLVAALIAIARCWPATPLATFTLVVTVGWMAVESAIYPHRLGSFGPVWSWVALGWAVLFLLVALRPRTARLPSRDLRG
ncbi:MAG TPA: hypothetical protein VFH66_02635 [Mycobacteriales bacterium]|nr:hypothetical protein [Mycobacteriales bacterium]